MSLVRAVPLKDFLSTAEMLSTSDVGDAYSTVPPESGQALIGALHLTAITTARTLAMTVQSASSSGFGALTTEITFALTSERGSTWQRLAAPSTDRPWRRANWALSTTTTADSWTGLVWIGFR